MTNNMNTKIIGSKDTPRIVGTIYDKEAVVPEFFVEITKIGPRGRSIEFDVSQAEYKIGIRQQGDTEYTYVEFGEAERISNENIRTTAEAARVSAENSRKAAENNRRTTETARDLAENTRISTENARISAEMARKNAETARDTAEDSRKSAETIRDTAETARNTAENLRSDAEVDRRAAEGVRASAETTRKNAETARNTAEDLRDSAEVDRSAAENLRKSAEVLRISTEENRNAAENIRISAETARNEAEILRTGAETDREAAESNRNVFEAYDPLKTYVVNNKVALNGSSYLALVENTGKSPDSNPTEWLLIARKGDPGEIENLAASHIENALGFLPLDKTYVDNKVKTDVPANAVFTDTKYSAGTNVSISGTTISATDTKYTAGTNVSISGTTISATDTKTTINGKTGAIAKADIVALGIPAQKTITSATEPDLSTGDEWHKEI